MGFLKKIVKHIRDACNDYLDENDTDPDEINTVTEATCIETQDVDVTVECVESEMESQSYVESEGTDDLPFMMIPDESFDEGCEPPYDEDERDYELFMKAMFEEFKLNKAQESKDNVKDTYRMGREFEEFAKSLFPEKNFILMHRTTSGYVEGRYAEDCINPDYLFRDKETKEEFWVECKFRSRRGQNGTLNWTDYYHLQRYKEVQQKTGKKVFILIGVGGIPKDPAELLFFPLDKVPYYSLYYCTQKKILIEPKPYRNLQEILNKI
ncbi:hypothetical protein [Candidatus Methanoprimaticola sp. MG2]|uniref:hypothetical protein n=1 Tax=Candidatus Methanoprimaticola sp. MG2 TaxID=3228838 RepID=UPI0039C7200F